jgi:hypothetical protein
MQVRVLAAAPAMTSLPLGPCRPGVPSGHIHIHSRRHSPCAGAGPPGPAALRALECDLLQLLLRANVQVGWPTCQRLASWLRSGSCKLPIFLPPVAA